MTRIPSIALAIILACGIGSGLAFAQTSKATDTKTTSQPAKSKDAKSDKSNSSKSDSSKSESTLTSVQNWTTKQWNAMTKEWSKDKAKWADCRKQSNSRKLSGRNSWSFLYDCMKKA